MAYQQGGYASQGQYSNPQASPEVRIPHGVPQHMAQPSYLRRNSSSNQGDDGQYRHDVNGDMEERAYGTRAYRAGSNAGMQNQELFMGASNTSSRSASYSSVPAPGAYHHQSTPSAPPATQSYNPQQYGPSQPQYPQQLAQEAPNPHNASHQPYVPAAYQSSNTSYPSYYGGQNPQSYQSSTYTQYNHQPPPPPPRNFDQRYSNRTSPQIGTSPIQNYASNQEHSYGHAPLPPVPNSTSSTRNNYTPPAPPPPPFSPDRDAFPSNIVPSAPQHSGHRYSLSQANQSSASYSPWTSQPTPTRQSSNGSISYSSPIASPPPRSSSYNRLNNSLPPTPGTPGPTPPAHSPHRTGTTARHPQARPLPGPPADTDYFGNQSMNGVEEDTYEEEPGYEDLMKEVEAAVMMGRASSLASQRSPQVRRNHIQPSIDEGHEPQGLFSEGSNTTINPDFSQTHTNGQINSLGAGQYINYDAYSDRSDAEAEAGLAAMHMADEQEAADEAYRHRNAEQYQQSYDHRRSHGSQQDSTLAAPLIESGGSSDSDVGVDMDSYGGGFPGTMHYGEQDLSHHSSQSNRSDADNLQRPPGWNSYSDISDLQRSQYDYSVPDQDDMYSYSTVGARVDTGGTGGLSEPGARRLSFEDGDEITLAESEGAQTSATQSPSKESMPEMFFHPGVSQNRPFPTQPVGSLSKNRVPHLMPAGTYQLPGAPPQYDGRPTFPPAPDAYDQLLTPSGTPVPRSSSLISHSSAPQTVPPIRSKTDADRAKILKQQLASVRTSSVYGSEFTPDSAFPQSADLLGLPEIPSGKRRKFNPSKLSSSDFKKCAEPWALSSIVAWVREMSEGTTDLKGQMITDGIVALFTHKVPTMNIADAETLGARVVSAMFDSGALLKEEEWVRFGEEELSGVLFQLTGMGCYSPMVHSQTLPGRCYSHHCMRTLKKINLQSQFLEPQRKDEDWATFYKISKETIESTSKKDIERQNVLHEVITTEDLYMDQLNVLRFLYRDELAKGQPPILSPKNKDAFLRDVFGKADAIKQVNEDYLLAQLKYRQQEQGPWIVGFSDIFREWVRKARGAYVDYAASFPNATFLVRREAERNLHFRQFLDQARENERSKRLGWDTYLKAPITRLQRYGLLLSTVHKSMPQDSEEKSNLRTAIEEIRVVTLECDARVAEMAKNVNLSELATKLTLRPGMEKVKLNLTHLGREVIFEGDLQRTGTNRFTWLETHAILFDHYLVLAKKVSKGDSLGGAKQEKYDVSKLPIPMDLLVLESANDDPQVKSNIKGIGSVAAVTTRATSSPQDVRNSRVSVSNGTGPGTLNHTNTSNSVASISTQGSAKTLVTTTVLDSPKDEKVLFPFRIKHLGKIETYTLYAASAQNRQDWCDKIVEAKTRHAASLFKQNAEPFRLRVIADTAFAYDAVLGTPKSIVIRGTPLDRAIQEVEERYRGKGRPNPVCRASVNCATSFNQPYGVPMIAIGTDYGVYIASRDNPRGWTRAINITRVTQIAVLEEFSLMVLIADKSLIAYHLDSVCPVGGSATGAEPSSTASNTQKRAPQKLSGARDVGFFATGRMKDRSLVFYKKREGISSIFKVLEPVYQKSSAGGGRRGWGGLRRGTTEFFRDFDEFYIASETYSINLFQSSLAISTAKGVEVMTLDKKVTFSIPDLKPPDCASIAARIKDQRPLGMFRLSESEFLLVFEEVGIYVNKHGDVSRAVVMEFVGKAKQATLWGEMYLVLVDQGGGFVEVRNAVNGRLRQVVSGRDVRLLDEGRGRGGSVKVAMQHPEVERCQVVVEMIVNEGLKE